MPLWLPWYIQSHGDLDKEVINCLLTISPATRDRILKPVRAKYKGREGSTARPGTLLRKQIPIKTNKWHKSRPGFLEADTVAHRGTSTAGMFDFSIDGVDITAVWTEQGEVW